jgi:hypothetical protein
MVNEEWINRTISHGSSIAHMGGATPRKHHQAC